MASFWGIGVNKTFLGLSEAIKFKWAKTDDYNSNVRSVRQWNLLYPLEGVLHVFHLKPVTLVKWKESIF